ncbi:DNA modification methylase [Endomicrobiia bacterium]|nr:DNA modification methylase [Endomicrobiia bacterium]GHT74131.1 DNA modification methylase [Endomicrobiia bacterium]
MYQVIRNTKYDYIGQSYASLYPNLHKYPATMLPQIGIDILKEFDATKGSLLDPYCGSGSSFVSGLECGLTKMQGFDVNPLAVLISKVKFTKIPISELIEKKQTFRSSVFEFLKNENNLSKLLHPQITNIDFWFSQDVINKLIIIKHFIDEIKNINVRNFFLVPFSEVVRECSYARNNEFKLFRIKSDELLNFNPDVVSVYLKKWNDIFLIYSNFYFPKIKNDSNINVRCAQFQSQNESFDVVLTSPPYGDSRTTVAYGQFSTLSNEWLGISFARKIDRMLMGGVKSKSNIVHGVIADSISQISKVDNNRALEVSSFYKDLDISIINVANSVRKGGKVMYIVGNRTVKNIKLPTDQFVAERFEAYGFKHIVTYERVLSNKVMPSKNSPTNKAGKAVNTMLYERIVVCEKRHMVKLNTCTT